MLVCVSFVHVCTRDRGCSAHPAFPAPLFRGCRHKTRTLSRRGNATPCSIVVAHGWRCDGTAIYLAQRKRGAGTMKRSGIRRMDMVPDDISPRGDLWRSIRRAAETALARDPIFGRSLSASVLDHP